MILFMARHRWSRYQQKVAQRRLLKLPDQHCKNFRRYLFNLHVLIILIQIIRIINKEEISIVIN